MKRYKITYHMHPQEDIVIWIASHNEDDACLYARSYRKDAFSIKEDKEPYIAYQRGFYYGFLAKHKDSPYRRYREYTGYLDRYLNNKDVIVDGSDYDRRRNEVPMSMTVYFG